jgi:hypothetical protein
MQHILRHHGQAGLLLMPAVPGSTQQHGRHVNNFRPSLVLAVVSSAEQADSDQQGDGSAAAAVVLQGTRRCTPATAKKRITSSRYFQQRKMPSWRNSSCRTGGKRKLLLAGHRIRGLCSKEHLWLWCAAADLVSITARQQGSTEGHCACGASPDLEHVPNWQVVPNSVQRAWI